jgi:hypothetical protein
MVIRFTCDCGRAIQAREEHAGRPGRCPACGVVLTIPSHDEPPGGESDGVRPAALPAEDEPAEEPAELPRFPASPGAPPGPRLYSPEAMAGMAFFTNPLGAALLLALNYRAQRRPGAALLAVLFGLAWAAVLVMVGQRLPLPDHTLLWLGIHAVDLVLVFGLARYLQGKA